MSALNLEHFATCRSQKIIFATARDATEARRRIHADEGRNGGRRPALKPYQCHWCGFWHLTSHWKKRA